MTAPTSTIVPAKKALASALRLRPALEGVLVAYADPGDKGRREQMFFAEVRQADQDPVALKAGRRRRDEEYELDLIVDCSSKPSAEAAESRCMELVAELEEELAEDTTIHATPGVLWALVTDLTLKTAETGDGAIARAVVTITVRARLT